MYFEIFEQRPATKRFSEYCILIILFVSLLSPYPSRSQTDTPAGTKKSDWFLLFGSSLGIDRFRDMGTAPITFVGPTIQPNISARYENNRWLFELNSELAFSYCEDEFEPSFNFTTFNISNLLQFKVLRQININFPQTAWIGFSLTNFIDVTVNPNYENSSAGVSEFIGPGLCLKARQPIKKSRYSLFGGLEIMPIGYIFRPGYSYIDNYSSQNSVTNTIFSDFQWNIRPFAELSTEIGIDLRLANNNLISISYLWRYFRTGERFNSDYLRRFDHAAHFINFTLSFNLQHK